MKITVTIEGSPQELKPVLQVIQAQEEAGLNKSEQVSIEKQPEKEQEREIKWTEGKIWEVWKDLSYDCMSVLAALSNYEDGIAWDDFVNRLKLKPNQIGGRLSSLGHQIRIHQYGRLPSPVHQYVQNNAYMYNLDPLWREVIRSYRKEIDAVGASETETTIKPQES